MFWYRANVGWEFDWHKMGFEDNTDKCAGWYSYLLSLVHLSVQDYTVFGVILEGDLAEKLCWQLFMRFVIM